MSFLDKVNEREAEKQRVKDDLQNKMPAWAQAVSQLRSLIVQRVQPKAARLGFNPPVLAKRGQCRVEGTQLDSLEITYNAEGKNVSVTPLSLSDARAKGAGGCVLLEGQSQVYQLLWDGKSQTVQGHWQIKDSDGGTQALTEDSLDETFKIVFGLIEKPPKLPKKFTRKMNFDDD